MNSIKKRVLSTLIATGLIAGAAVPAFASVNVEAEHGIMDQKLLFH